MNTVTPPPVTAYRAVFDNNCPLCVRLAAWCERKQFLPKGNTIGFDFLEADDRARVDEQRFKHEFALLGPANEPTRYGLEAIGKVLSFRKAFFAALKPGNAWFRIVNPVYHACADTRYLWVPKQRTPIKCACEPPFSMKWRVLFALLCNLLAVAGGLLVAGALAYNSPEPYQAITRFFAVTAPGWMVLLVVMFPVLGRERWGDYLVHVGIVHVAGVAALLPIVALAWLPDGWFMPAFWMCVGFSFTTMLRIHYQRMKAVGKPAPLTLAWAVILNTIAITLLLTINTL